MNISEKDRILGNKIDQTMKEYNNISKQLYESKMQFFKRNNLNNYNYINRTNPLNSPFKDYDLQKRITNSLYAGKNRNNLNIKKYSPFIIKQSNTNSNFLLNNNNLRPLSSYNNTNDIIQDFKTTLKQTQALITNKILPKNNFCKNAYSNRNHNYNFNLDTENNNLSYNSSVHSDYSEVEGGNSSLDGISDDLDNNYNAELNNYKYNNDFKLNNIIRNNNNNIILNNNIINNKKFINTKNEDEEKLKLSIQILKKTNQDLRNQNRILEVEITNYKTQENNLKGNSNIFTHFDEKLQTFIMELKKNLKNSITKNIETMDTIFSSQKDNQEIFNKNKKLGNDHSKLAGKIEEENRRKAEIQCTNEENEKKISTLTEEKNNSLKDIEKLKIELLNLKNSENNFSILKDSCLKRKKDNNELLNKLKSTIEQLDKEKKETKEKAKSTTNKNEQMKNLLKSFDLKISELKNLIEKINKEKNDLIEANANMNIELKTNNNKINEEIALKEMKLKEELNDVNIENEEKRNKIAEMEIKIQTLKDHVNKVNKIILKENKEEELKKLKIEEILEENEEEKKEEKNLEENLLQKDFKNAIDENKSIKKEIENNKKIYENMIKQKDGIIEALDQQLKLIHSPQFSGIGNKGKSKVKNKNNKNNIMNINNLNKKYNFANIELNDGNEEQDEQNQQQFNMNLNDDNINNDADYNYNNNNINDELLNEMNNNNIEDEYNQQFQDDEEQAGEEGEEGEEHVDPGDYYYNNDDNNMNEINDLNDLEHNYLDNENNMEEQNYENQDLQEGEYNNDEYLQQQYNDDNEEEMNEGIDDNLNGEMDEDMNDYMNQGMYEEEGEEENMEGINNDDMNMDMNINYENGQDINEINELEV